MKPLQNNRYFILQGRETVPCPDLMEWARAMIQTDPQVGLARIGPYTVSTVFLGINLAIHKDGMPRLFETMVFEGERDTSIYSGRCATWTDAEIMHRSACDAVVLRLADHKALGLDK